MVKKCPDCGKPKKKHQHRCDKCWPIHDKIMRQKYYKRNIKKYKAYRKKYYKEHLDEIHEYNKNWNKQHTIDSRIAKQKLLDDIIANPRKYLNRVKLNANTRS